MPAPPAAELFALQRAVALGKQPEDLLFRPEGLEHREAVQTVAQSGGKVAVPVGDARLRRLQPVSGQRGQQRKRQMTQISAVKLRGQLRTKRVLVTVAQLLPEIAERAALHRIDRLPDALHGAFTKIVIDALLHVVGDKAQRVPMRIRRSVIDGRHSFRLPQRVARCGRIAALEPGIGLTDQQRPADLVQKTGLCAVLQPGKRRKSPLQDVFRFQIRVLREITVYITRYDPEDGSHGGQQRLREKRERFARTAAVGRQRHADDVVVQTGGIPSAAPQSPAGGCPSFYSQAVHRLRRQKSRQGP